MHDSTGIVCHAPSENDSLHYYFLFLGSHGFYGKIQLKPSDTVPKTKQQIFVVTLRSTILIQSTKQIS